MRVNSPPPQDTFKAPWKIIVYSKVMLQLYPDWKQTLVKEKCNHNNQKGKAVGDINSPPNETQQEG